jgi:hypothetical protein
MRALGNAGGNSISKTVESSKNYRQEGGFSNTNNNQVIKQKIFKFAKNCFNDHRETRRGLYPVKMPELNN